MYVHVRRTVYRQFLRSHPRQGPFQTYCHDCLYNVTALLHGYVNLYSVLFVKALQQQSYVQSIPLVCSSRLSDTDLIDIRCLIDT